MIPKYIQLKDALNDAIIQKKYPLYSKLPTEIELAKDYKVSRATVRQALALLEADGIIEKKWGSGNTVINTKDDSKKNTIALIIPSLSSVGDLNLYDELSSILSKQKFTIETYETNNSLEREREILSSFSTDIYAGYIIKPAASALPSVNSDYFQKLLKWQQPVVFIGKVPDSIYSASNVEINDYECGYMCARYFINKGKNNTGALFNILDYKSFSRYLGFISAFRDANLSFPENLICWIGTQDANVKEYISNNLDALDGLVCDDEILVSSIYNTLIQIGNMNEYHFEIVCCQDTISEGSTPVPVTTMGYTKSLSHEIADIFLSIKKDGSNKSATINYKLIQR